MVANEIIKQRLMDQLREVDGATYSPNGDVEASESIPNYGYLAVGVEIAPERIGLFQQRLSTIIADLGAKPISPDELARAKTPLIQTRLRDFQQNAFWLGALENIQRDPRVGDLIRTRESGIGSVDAAKVLSVVAKYLDGEQPFTLSSMPEGPK